MRVPEPTTFTPVLKSAIASRAACSDATGSVKTAWVAWVSTVTGVPIAASTFLARAAKSVSADAALRVSFTWSESPVP